MDALAGPTGGGQGQAGAEVTKGWETDETAAQGGQLAAPVLATNRYPPACADAPESVQSVGGGEVDDTEPDSQCLEASAAVEDESPSVVLAADSKCPILMAAAFEQCHSLFAVLSDQAGRDR